MVSLTVSGLSGSRGTAQSQVLTGMGLLAGSTVFLLTLLWGTCVVVGKCDLGPNHEAVDLTNTMGFSLTGTVRNLPVKFGSRNMRHRLISIIDIGGILSLHLHVNSHEMC